MSFSQYGGARLGPFNATWPLAKLTVEPQELRLTVLGVIKMTFPKSSITRLGEHRGFISRGLRIEHRGARAPQYVVFWTWNLAALLEALRVAGYQTS
jgi:hypothetical protein